VIPLIRLCLSHSPVDHPPTDTETCLRGVRSSFRYRDGGRSTKHDRTYGQGLDAGKDAAWPGVECSD